MTIGDRIRQAREQRLALTQEELALQLGVRAITVSRWERGVVEPRPRHIRELARITELPISWFFSEGGVAA